MAAKGKIEVLDAAMRQSAKQQLERTITGYKEIAEKSIAGIWQALSQF